MRESEVTGAIVDASILVHRELGPGLLESVYEVALAHELTRRGFSVKRQVSIPVVFQGEHLGEGFRADLIVEELVIVEIKSLELVPPVAYKVLLTYLRLAGKRVGMLINFREELLKNGIKRIVNDPPTA